MGQEQGAGRSGDWAHPGQTKVRVWLPTPLYRFLRAQAVEQGVPLTQVIRDLIQAGLAAQRQQDRAAENVERLERFMREHLEPLAYVAAIEAAAGRHHWRMQHEAVARETGADEGKARAAADTLDGLAGRAAAERVRRALAKGGGGDGED